MKYYHGTMVGDLTTLKPFASPFSNLKQACVYLSTNKQLAAVYIWNRPFKWMTFEIGEDGVPIYTESFPNSLKEFYDGVKGYIYTCEGDYTTNNATGIRCAAISQTSVPIIGCEVIENAYAQFLEYEKEGSIIINRFETLTQTQHDSNKRMVLSTIKRLNLLESTHPMSSFVEEKFPDLLIQSKINLENR